VRKIKLLNDFERDLAKSFLLSKFIGEWGTPSIRTKFRFLEEELAEIYVFSSTDIVRLCSFGCLQAETEDKVMHEVLCVFDTSDPEYSDKRAMAFMSDCLQYFFTAEKSLEVPQLVNFNFDQSRRRVILFDEARGEPDSVSLFDFDNRSFQLVWASEIKNEELIFIQKHGMEKFDRLVDDGTVDLLRVSRKPRLSLK